MNTSAPPEMGMVALRRMRPNQSSAASAPSRNGTANAPQPSSDTRNERHQCSTAPWSAMSATMESTANASKAIAPTSLRMRGSIAATAPRCGWRRDTLRALIPA